MQGKELSTHVDFTTKHSPKGMQLVSGQWYETLDNYGAYNKVQVVGLKQVGEGLIVHYRRKIEKRKWYSVSSWQYMSKPIEQFRELLLELGSIPSVNLQPK